MQDGGDDVMGGDESEFMILAVRVCRSVCLSMGVVRVILARESVNLWHTNNFNDLFV